MKVMITPGCALAPLTGTPGPANAHETLWLETLKDPSSKILGDEGKSSDDKRNSGDCFFLLDLFTLNS